MRVAAKISQHMLGPAEWRFAVYDPVFAICLAQERGEHIRAPQRLQRPVEVQPATSKRLLESLGELAAEDFLQHSYWQKEAGLRCNPPAVAGNQTAGWNHAVDMRM